MQNIIVFDLDGTLADDSHRQRFLLQEPKNWGAFFEACHADRPVLPVIEMARGYDAVRTIASSRNKTGTFFDHIQLRPGADHRDGETVKKEWLDEERAKGNQVVLAIEDRTRVVNMWRENGVPCFQVKEGNF